MKGKQGSQCKKFPHCIRGIYHVKGICFVRRNNSRIYANEKTEFESITNKSIYDITQDDIQKIVNKKSKKCSPKIVRNLHGMISAVMKYPRPEFALNTTLPQRKRPKLYIPPDAEVKKLLEAARNDKDMLIAIILAAFGPIIRSEICGLQSEDIKNNVAHVQRAIILGENN